MSTNTCTEEYQFEQHEEAVAAELLLASLLALEVVVIDTSNIYRQKSSNSIAGVWTSPTGAIALGFVGAIHRVKANGDLRKGLIEADANRRAELGPEQVRALFRHAFLHSDTIVPAGCVAPFRNALGQLCDAPPKPAGAICQNQSSTAPWSAKLVM